MCLLAPKRKGFFSHYQDVASRAKPRIKFLDINIGHHRFYDVLSIARLGPLRSGFAQVSNPLHYEGLNVSLPTGLDVKPLGDLPWEVDYGKVQLEVKTSNGIFGGRATFKYILELQLGSTSMRLVAMHRGREVGVTDMPYEPNSEEWPERGYVLFNAEEWLEREVVMSNAKADLVSSLQRRFGPLPCDRAEQLTNVT